MTYSEWVEFVVKSFTWTWVAREDHRFPRKFYGQSNNMRGYVHVWIDEDHLLIEIISYYSRLTPNYQSYHCVVSTQDLNLIPWVREIVFASMD